ncbi:DUF6731 family protein [Ottowia pentelensis]|uniref:DUF6731 family protein n=1 Tax=Ottowia pentelensis TaxID=511108 RepID=A0ABV6PTL4_9BURK
MSKRTFQVRFARPVVGADAAPLAPTLRELSGAHGAHLPAHDVGGERYQVRDLVRTGSVWRGVFGKLRDDAPHLVNGADEERELPLADGDRLLEKCHWLYRERGNLLVWQLNRASGGLTRFENYLSHLTGVLVQAPPIMNTGQIEEVLNHRVYEISYGYDRPPALDAGAPRWNQQQFDKMRALDAGHAKFEFRAQRKGQLTERAKEMVREAIGLTGVRKVRVRLTDHDDPIELFAAPLKDKISVEVLGRYPAASDVFAELEDAYDRNRSHIGAADAPA